MAPEGVNGGSLLESIHSVTARGAGEGEQELTALGCWGVDGSGAIAKVLKQGQSLQMKGLGTFTLVHKEGFRGRARGKVVKMKPRTVLVFRMEEGLRAELDEVARQWRRSE